MVRPEISRAKDDVFVGSCHFSALQERLPLHWPKPANAPSSPKKSYRSIYRYLGWEELEDPVNWAVYDDFELLLRLVDFSSLRDVLSERLGWSSA